METGKSGNTSYSVNKNHIGLLLVFVGLVAFITLTSANNPTATTTVKGSLPSAVHKLKDDTTLAPPPRASSSPTTFLKTELALTDKYEEVAPSEIAEAQPAAATKRLVDNEGPVASKAAGRKYVKATYQPSAERLKRYVDKEYAPAPVDAAGELLWSFDRLEAEQKALVASAKYPSGDQTKDKNLLFIDGREKCENAREFLIRVRQSGFLGKIVFLAYYLEDEADCQPLANDFQPMTIFYRKTQLIEPTMMQYYGLLNYVKAFPEEFEHDDDRSLYHKTIMVKPEAVFWCNSTNPFDDIPTLAGISDSDPKVWPYDNRYKTRSLIKRETIYGVVGEQSDHNFAHVEFKASPYICVSPNGRWNGTEEDKRKENKLLDSFVATSNPNALIKFARLLLEFFETKEHDEPRPSFHIYSNIDPAKKYLEDHLVQMEPAHRYGPAVCHNYLPEDNSKCYDCDLFTIIAGTTRCMRRVTYDVPNYSPFCLHPYREPIMEVPYKMTMHLHAKDKTLKGAHIIRDQPNGIFNEEPDPMRTVSELCPNGVLGVLTMMAGYDINKVRPFVASFLSYGHPNCTKMIMMVKPGMNMEKTSMMFPDRVEYVHLDENSEYAPVKMKGCGAADFRFEVAQRWLEKNYKRFKYIMATDSRDYIFLADPLKQLASILKKQNYEDDEFIGSVAEHFAVGGAAHPTTAVTYFLRSWLHSCGEKCFRRLGHMAYTNGEPFAVLNSGHIIGTSLGLLHYYRFHVRMMNESDHKCDGSDQGLFTYYMYGMMQEAHYPHKVLVFSSSRSGFANLPSPSRMSKRNRTDLLEGETPLKEREKQIYYDSSLSDEEKAKTPDVFSYEYTITDCNNNIIAGLHQFDRHYPDYGLLERAPASWRPFYPWLQNKTLFDLEFMPKPK